MPRLTSKLPEKLSDCLTVALADMDKCHKDPKFRVIMSVYFGIKGGSSQITPETPCSVCLAGSMIAQTLNGPDMEKYDGMNPADMLKEGYITLHDKRRLYALDRLRLGELFSAFKCVWPNRRFPKELGTITNFSIRHSCFMDNLSLPSDYKRFRQDLFKLRNYLAKKGF